jgi:prephenate dehydratase
MTKRIAFQGELGAYSHEAAYAARPDMAPLPCKTFDDVIDAVRSKAADLAVLPVENSTYGRVADMHRLLPQSGLHIIGETFTRVRICLMANPGVTIDEIQKVRAHLVLLPQADGFLKKNNILAEAAADSAGAAAELAQSGARDSGVLASELAAKSYGLNILAKDIEDYHHNTTRFLVMSPNPDYDLSQADTVMTTFVFQVRNIPAALYKALGGFATNGVNMTKIESYMVGGSFTATQFYADIEGHPNDENVKRAMEELEYFTDSITILGIYPAAKDRV